jgi:hypothetical protein
MFSKLFSVKKFSREIISIEQLVEKVRNNNQKKLIEDIRASQPKSKEYNNLKLKVSCITPHTIQKGLKNDDIIKLSKYLYYDIDNFKNIDELNRTIENLNSQFPVSFICRSVGGMGISILIKLDETNFILDDTNFILVYKYVRSLLIDKGFNIDMYAGGISRKMNISSDEDCIFNKEASLSIRREEFEDFKRLGLSNNKTPLKRLLLRLDEPLYEVIPYEELIGQISLKTIYKGDINELYVIEDMDYYSALSSNNIPDGSKHKTYIRIINSLYAINPDINRNQVYSYLYHINNLQNKKMNFDRLKSLIDWLCNEIETTGEIMIQPYIKKIHFKENVSKKDRQSMGVRLSNAVRTNITIKKINEAKDELSKKNIIPTQKMISEITNLSLSTIKRNWNKSEIDIDRALKIKYVSTEDEGLDEYEFWAL